MSQSNAIYRPVWPVSVNLGQHMPAPPGVQRPYAPPPPTCGPPPSRFGCAARPCAHSRRRNNESTSSAAAPFGSHGEFPSAKSLSAPRIRSRPAFFPSGGMAMPLAHRRETNRRHRPPHRFGRVGDFPVGGTPLDVTQGARPMFRPVSPAAMPPGRSPAPQWNPSPGGAHIPMHIPGPERDGRWPAGRPRVTKPSWL